MPGRSVLLAGAIVQAAWGCLLVWYSTGWHPGPTLYFLSTVAVAGVALALIAYLRARAGHARQAMTLGIVASCLPPLQVVTLVGAILCGTMVGPRKVPDA